MAWDADSMQKFIWAMIPEQKREIYKENIQKRKDTFSKIAPAVSGKCLIPGPWET